MTDAELETWRAQIEAKRDRTAYFRRAYFEAWNPATPVQRIRGILSSPDKHATRKPRTATTGTARPTQPHVRPCPTCGHPTRTSKQTPAEFPGTKVRGRGDLCTTCIWEAKRTPDMRRKEVLIDVPAAVRLYATGQSCPQIAHAFGVSKSKVRRELMLAGVTIRGCSEAARLARAS